MSIEAKINGGWVPVAGGVSNSNAPIGAIFPFGGSSAPSGYLMCDGSAVSRSDYSALFAVIGTSFGSGDGSTTFNIPDLREATTKGVGLSGKSSNHYDSDGVALGEFIDDRNKSHTHDMSNHTHSGTTNSMNQNAEHRHQILVIGSNNTGTTFVAGTRDGGSLLYTNSESTNTDHLHTFTTGAPSNNTTGSSGSATNEVKAVGVNFIIKAKDVNLSGGGQALADRVSALETVTTPTITVNTTGVNWRETPTVRKIGHTVQVSGIITSINDTTSEYFDLITGLPTPVMASEYEFVAFKDSDTLNYWGCYLNTQGSFRAYERGAGFLRISFTYLTAT